MAERQRATVHGLAQGLLCLSQAVPGLAPTILLLACLPLLLAPAARAASAVTDPPLDPASAADSAPPPDPGIAAALADAPRVRLPASDRYRAGPAYRVALGDGYRDLWETPIELPLLDLGRIGGGLEPTRRFGGLQTAVLGFRGRNGRSYTFRATDKDPSAVLDEVLHDTLVAVLVQDQMAAQHPGAPPVAAALTEAAGLRTVHERMVVMPDDPRLGEFREEFAGLVGTFFEYPQPAEGDRAGYAGAVEILDHDELYAALAEGREVEVDVRAFLRARLVDLLLGDFDRHRKQWRWMVLPGEPRLQPLPEDRDQAFVRYDGLAQSVLRIYVPILQNYGAEYPGMEGLTLHGWEQDRWLLPALSWTDWEREVEAIQARLSDAAIEGALVMLPAEYAALDGVRLRRDVRGRRAALLEGARRFYEHLAREVDIQTSDASDRIEVDRDVDGSTRVRVSTRTEDGTPGRLLFARRFLPEETKDLRIYLRGGDDRVVVRGGRGPITLRVVAGEGSKRIDDAAGGGTRIYDEHGSTEVFHGPGTEVDRRPYTPPPPDPGFVDVEDVPPRDWGTRTIPLPEFGFQPDVGVFLGASAAHTRYGFRRDPWSSKHSLGFGWAFEANAPRVRYRGRFRPENSRVLGEVDLQYSGIEVLQFYGFGNETDDSRSDSFYRVRNQQYLATARAVVPVLRDRARVAVGPYVKVSRTSNGVRLVDELNPYGNNDFGLLGVEIELEFDTRSSLPTPLENLELPFHDNAAAGYPTSGWLIEVTGRFNPPLIDVKQTYGSIEGSIARFFSFGPDALATLGLRIGGMETFGRTPFFDAATIGGGRFFAGDSSNRGFRSRRFYGDSSLYGNVDLRLLLGRFKIIVPSDVGVQGFVDVGRVFLHDEDSDDWHPSGGGGIWIAPIVRTNTLSVSAAASHEDTLVYVRFGFHY